MLLLSPDLRDWVLLPIMIIMVLIEAFRHYLFLYLAGSQKTNLKAIREEQALARIRALRTFHFFIPAASYEGRKAYYLQEIGKNAFLKNPNAAASGVPTNPLLSDPSSMDAMTEMMKKNASFMRIV